MSYKKCQIEGKPEWAEIGVMVMVRDDLNERWQGPAVLQGFCRNRVLSGSPFLVDEGWWNYAKPVGTWEPKEGEFCAFWNEGATYFGIMPFMGNRGSVFVAGTFSATFAHIARLGPDVDAACDVETLKTRTDWL